MRKTDKKIDNKIRVVLTEVCQFSEEQYQGFCWITHTVNYTHFPKSLLITCVFDTQSNLDDFLLNKSDRQFNQLVRKKLNGINISLKDIDSHIDFTFES